MLILRDLSLGLARYENLRRSTGVTNATLSDRLKHLGDHELIERRRYQINPERYEYVLTRKGTTLWPVVRSLLAWGDEHYSDGGPRRVFHHVADGAAVNGDGTCATCGQAVAVQDLLVTPGPGLAITPGGPDPVSVALASPHRLLEPVRS